MLRLAKPFFLKYLPLLAWIAVTLSTDIGFAGSTCESLVVEYTQNINIEMTKRYPELSFVVADPDGFINEMNSRFENQKKVTPENPHHFDYSEVGLREFKYALEKLTEKINQVSDQMSEKPSVIARVFRWNASAEKEIALAYYRDLQSEAQEVLSQGKVSYQQTVEFTYYFSRAIGHFDTRKLSLLKRLMLAVDRSFQGYKHLSIEDEYKMYRERKFEVFQKSSSVTGLVAAQAPFLSAYQNKNYLETIFVPIHDEIDTDILMRLLSKNINLIGVTALPIDADGFSRPGGDFWMHDVRHESDNFYKRFVYYNLWKMTPRQIKILDMLQDKWFAEMYEEIEKIQDLNLREAVKLSVFNWHHDQGNPLIPSIWLKQKKNPIIYALVFALKLSGQGPKFNNTLANLKKANDWMTSFWSKRLDEELGIFKE